MENSESVAEVNHALAETSYLQQFEVQADIIGEKLLATSDHDRRDEHVALVDQPGPDRLRGEVGTAQSKLPSWSAM